MRRTATHVIGWELARRHWWPLVAIAAYMLVLAVIRIFVLGPLAPITVVPPDGRAAVLIAPLSLVYWYYLAVFSFGFSGDLAGRPSNFPSRLLTLPVSTASLVRGPMLYGTATVGILGFAATLHSRWPWGIEGPLLWPALLMAVLLAWTQALMWMPYGLPGLRVLLVVFALITLDTVVLLSMHFGVSEPVMLTFLIPQLPLAYLTACGAVARARRGEVPDWVPSRSRLFTRTAPRARTEAPFPSPQRAQAWFEWRERGRALPAAVAMVLPFELALLWLATDAPMMVLEILVLVAITPIVLASFGEMTSSGPDAGYRVPPFLATRPLGSASLVAAKLEAALWSTLTAWLLIVVAVPLALVWSDNWELVVARATRLTELVGMPRTIVFALLIGASAMTFTWRSLVQRLSLGLTGRVWVIRGHVILVLVLVVALAPAAQWIVDDIAGKGWFFGLLPEILAALAALKMLSAAVVATRLTGSGLLSDGALFQGAALWVVTVFALYGTLAWLVAGPLIPRFFLLLVAILLVPLSRVAAAPGALAMNRHR